MGQTFSSPKRRSRNHRPAQAVATDQVDQPSRKRRFSLFNKPHRNANSGTAWRRLAGAFSPSSRRGRSQPASTELVPPSQVQQQGDSPTLRPEVSVRSMAVVPENSMSASPSPAPPLPQEVDGESSRVAAIPSPLPFSFSPFPAPEASVTTVGSQTETLLLPLLSSTPSSENIGDQSEQESQAFSRQSDVNNSPEFMVSQILALAALITARQLFGWSDTNREEHFATFIDSLYNGLHADELNSALFGSGSVNADNPGESLSRNSSANSLPRGDANEQSSSPRDEEDVDEADAGSAGPGPRPSQGPSYFRMFRFNEDDRGMVPVIILSMWPTGTDMTLDMTQEASDMLGSEPPDFNFSEYGQHVPSHVSLGQSGPSEIFAEAQSNGMSTPGTSSTAPETDATAFAAQRLPDNARLSQVIHVWGGTYPRNHPLFMAPSLLTANPTYEDLLYIEELLGQHKPRVATQAEIDKAGGLETLTSDSALIEESCAVCLAPFEVSDVCRRLKCKHIYHQVCVDQWLSRGQNTCPLCRETGVPKSEDVGA